MPSLWEWALAQLATCFACSLRCAPAAELQAQRLALLAPRIADLLPEESPQDFARPAQEGRLHVPSQHSIPWQSLGEVVIDPRGGEVLQQVDVDELHRSVEHP